VAWIASGKSSEFVTNSSDAASFAKVLAELGLELLMVGCSPRDHNENRLLVIYSVSNIPAIQLGSGHATQKRGVRIPLNYLEQCVTLWPGDSKDRVKYRRLFRDGSLAAAGTQLLAVKTYPFLPSAGDDGDVFYAIKGSGFLRQNYGVDVILSTFLLTPSFHAVEAVSDLTDSWPLKSRVAVCHWVRDIWSEIDLGKDRIFLEPDELECLAELEIFILGYYYAVLSPLVDASQLSVQEVYGSWGWNDGQILEATRKFVLAREDGSRRYPRFQVMKLVGYFYAGAAYEEQLLRVREGTVGILGKLTLVTASVLGGADTPRKVEKFWLLDVDSTCIPSNTLGVVSCGIQRCCPSKELRNGRVTRLCLDDQPTNQSDFTSHIEPDWDCDVQKLLVAYRHHGRIVQRISPLVTDRLVLRCWILPVDDVDPPDKLEHAIPINLENFHGGSRIFIWTSTRSESDDPGCNPRLVVLTGSAPNARACIVGMYNGVSGVALGSNSLAKAAEDERFGVIII